MSNLFTKVTLRKRPIANGQMSLYLDFYPAIRHPKTGRITRRETLGIYIYAQPKEKFQEEYNRSMLQKAELIRCRRTESVINEDFGFIDHSKGRESFLDYFRDKMVSGGNSKNWGTAFNHFAGYCGGVCTFSQLTIEFCQGFLPYLMSQPTPKGGKMMASTANNNLDKLKCVLRKAHGEGKLKDDIASKLTHAKEQNTKREFLTLDEVKMLANTPCVKPVLKAASIFSCLTGLRISDIMRLKWENIVRGADGGWCMHIVTKKTKTEAVLPISDEALSWCGERGGGLVFEGLSLSHLRFQLKDWIKDAGISKHITFHCFRHTYATLQLAAGTNIMTISKMLTHSNLATTQVYADVVNNSKREASKKISLK